LSCLGRQKLRELLKKLKKFGIVTKEGRGKGSERILYLPNSSDPNKGEIFTIKDHGLQTEIFGKTILAVLRRFNVDPDEFWKEP